MSVKEHIQRAHRYLVDKQWHSAWPFSEIETVIESMAKEQLAIISLALAYRWQDNLSEEWPSSQESLENHPAFAPEGLKITGFEDLQFFTVFEENIQRKVGESWPDFVLRSQREARKHQAELPMNLDEKLRDAESENFQLLCRLVWNSEKEWYEYFGMNLIELHRGDYDEPESGEDAAGIRYHFKYPGTTHEHSRRPGGGEVIIDGHISPTRKAGRRIFRIAEQISADFPRISQETCEFMKAEWKKELPHEEIDPVIVFFRLTYSEDWENITIIAALNDTNPENEPLYNFWEVVLENFKPIYFTR